MPLAQAITINGFSDIPEHQIVTLTILPVGDADGGGTDIAIAHNEQQSEVLSTEYDIADPSDAAV